MLAENIRNLRKAKGLSQDELGVQLNVVRQTISKWEKGISVPDSEMLVRIANALDTTVSTLLDETNQPVDHSELDVIAAKLEILNSQMVRLHDSRRKIWHIIFILLLCAAAYPLLRCITSYLYLRFLMHSFNQSNAIIGGADGPTTIYVTSNSFDYLPLIAAAAIAILALVGIYKTSKKD